MGTAEFAIMRVIRFRNSGASKTRRTVELSHGTRKIVLPGSLSRAFSQYDVAPMQHDHERPAGCLT
jgi:hypothetical protein